MLNLRQNFKKDHKRLYTIVYYCTLLYTIVSWFTAYLRNKLIQLITKYVYLPRQKNPTVNWTNNNAESVNHILKLDLDWKPRNLYDLTNKLYETVPSQYVDLQRALYDRGNYVFVNNINIISLIPSVGNKK